ASGVAVRGSVPDRGNRARAAGRRSRPAGKGVGRAWWIPVGRCHGPVRGAATAAGADQSPARRSARRVIESPMTRPPRPPILLAHSYYLRHDEKQVRKMKPYPPLATLIMAAVLRQQGHDVGLFDAMLASGEQEFERLLDDTRQIGRAHV